MSKSQRILPLLIALLPVQLNKFFFSQESFVLGIPIDYLAYSLYLSDITIAIYLVFFLFENRQNLKAYFSKRKHFVLAFSIFNLYLVLNSIYISKLPPVSLYASLKFLEFGLLALFASFDLSDNKTLKSVKKVATFSLLWQGALAIYQFTFQRSFGFWFLGERSFDASTPSIAHANFFDSLILRPYGSFPHPNVLGAFFVIFLIIILDNYFKNGPSLTRINLAFKLTLATSVLATVLTNSKTALFILLICILLTLRSIKQIIYLVVFLLLSAFAYVNLLSYSYLTSIAERLVLFQAAFKISLVSPLFGIGSNNFIPELAKLNLYSIGEVRLLQPVHNVFLLILSEDGVIGLLLFASLLLAISKNALSLQKLVLFFSLLIYLSVDHFLWTLHQGQFLFAIATAYILSSQSRSGS